MFTVTENAANALRVVMGEIDAPGCGVRIAKNDSSQLDGTDTAIELRLDVVTAMPANDEVVTAPGGVLVFIERDALALVEDRVLDGSIDEVGHPTLFLKAG